MPTSPADRCERLLRHDRLLFERYRDRRRPADREVLVRRMLPLARKLAAGYCHSGEPFDDLFQVACLGLVQAIDRFEPARGAAFSSFAVPTILGELRRYFRDKTWAVRVPRDLQELGLGVQRAGERLTADLGRQPTVAELAGALRCSQEAVLAAREAMCAYRSTSFETLCAADGGDAQALAATLGQNESGYQRAEDRALLDDLLQVLTEREREVVRLRFDEDLTQEEIGRRVGVSQMQVSRMLRASLARLREHRERGHDRVRLAA